MGYDVDAELIKAKARAATKASKENDPEIKAALAEVDETHWLCMYYVNAVKRRIAPAARLVERAPALAANPLALKFASVIQEIEEASRRVVMAA